MLTIGIPNTVHQIMGIFYLLRMWSDKDIPTLGDSLRRLLYFAFYVIFVLSVAVGALTTDDKDESVFLTVMLVIAIVLAYRMWIILWQMREFLFLVHRIGTHSTNNRADVIRINKKLDGFLKFVRYFLLVYAFNAIFCGILYPITTKRLIFNIAFPFELNNSDVTFWLASVIVCGGSFCSAVCAILTKIIWFLMLSISFEYEILGNQLRHMGEIRTESNRLEVVSFSVQKQLFFKDFISAIQTFDKINGMLEEFSSYFGKMFSMQVATGSVCICGSVYTLAFSSHENLIQDGIYCVVLAYCLFDIFMIMYLGNEIKLSSEKLSQCVFESNWIEQTQSSKKCIIIIMERLRRPEQLIVGKLYPLNLLTFTSIINGAYRIFNILQSYKS